MNWTLLVTKPAQKDLASVPNKDQVRLQRALTALQSDPFSGDIKRLQPAGWRRRLGSYRIFFDLEMEQRLIIVTAIKRRTTTTY